MKTKSLKLPIIILVCILVAMVAAHLVTSVCKKPAVTEQDFNYSVTYKVDGVEKTLNGVYTSRFVGFGSEGVDPLCRYYEGEYTMNGIAEQERCYTIDKKDGYELYIVMLFNDSYLMGDTKNDSYESALDEPLLEASDKDGNQYDQEQLPEVFDAEIVSWEYPKPIENTFVFAKFAGFHDGSTLLMMAVGILGLILCMILVRKGKDVDYNVFDILGIVFNFLIFFAALPVISIASFLIQAFPTGPDWIYQVYLLIPPVILLSLAASVSLRRKGFRKSGFGIQFFGIAVMIITAILEYVL